LLLLEELLAVGDSFFHLGVLTLKNLQVGEPTLLLPYVLLEKQTVLLD
jgi:hypothetical protein